MNTFSKVKNQSAYSTISHWAMYKVGYYYRLQSCTTSPQYTFLSLLPSASLLCYQVKLMLVMQNDSNRGSVKSTISSSDACQLSALEVKWIKLSLYSVENVSTSLFSFPTQRLWSISCGNKLRAGNIVDETCLCFSESFDSFTCPERKKSEDTVYFSCLGG